MLPIVEGLGLVWVGLQVLKQGRAAVLLRLFVDKAGGLRLQDCIEASRQIYAVLGVASANTHYNLEVSSPGLDRLLFDAVQCAPYVGRTLALRLRVERDAKRHVKGCLQSVEGQTLCLRMPEGVVALFDFATISEARLVPE
jgi:ribosome maturation factor RimP